MSTDSIEKKNENLLSLLQYNHFEDLYGRGGAFLVTPLNKGKIFSKEMFTEDQKMFANAAYEYATTRMIPLKDDNPTQGRPIVSYGIIGFCILIFLAQTGLS